MTEPRFNVVLTGHTQADQDATGVAAKLAALMKLPQDKAQGLLQGRPSKVKSDLDETSARRYLGALEKTGAQVRLDPTTPAPEPTPTPTPELQKPQQATASTPAAPAPDTTPYASPADPHLHPDGIRYCPQCGAQVNRLARVCPSCQRNLPALGRSREIAAVLALLPTGAWGIHRFYLGQWWGVFYLLFCWSGIPSLISLIEFFVFIFTSRDSWDRQHGHKSKVSGWIWVIPSAFIIISILGILAAVAIPAYVDYTARSKVSQTLLEVEPLEQDIVDYIQRTDSVPDSGTAMGKDDVGDLTHATWTISDNAVITLTFNDSVEAIRGETLTLIPFLEDESFIWDCTGGTVATKYRPSACRPD